MAVKFGYIKSKLGTILGVTPFYPIGYIIEETSGVNPSKWYGGTWELYGKGCVTACIDSDDSDSNSKTNFNKAVGTKIGNKRMQAHAHNWDGINPGASAGSNPGNYPFAIHQDRNVNWNGSKSAMHNAGSGDSENIQPTILIYRWRKIAY